ncbi:hypothetical protein [Chitinophaga sp. YIM B06452]|uniref:hypothetical protein n=1 Tax=Chitinophaga sp. YIM B06452 TaxID=3082158 RepID=UPI0031FE4414
MLWLGGDYDGAPALNFPENNCIYCEAFWNTRFKLDTLTYRSPRIVRSELHSTVYHPETGSAVTESQKFDYDNLLHIQVTGIRSKNSKGDSLVNYFKRPQDYNFFTACTNCDTQLDAGLLNARGTYFAQQKQWLDTFYYYVRLRDAAYMPLYPEKISYAKTQFLNDQSQMKTLELATANNNATCRFNRVSCIANIKINLSESEQAICRMLELNNILPVIEEKGLTNNVLMQTKVTDYFWQSGDYVTPWKVKVSQLSALPEERLEFTKYEKGNPVQLRKTDDIPVSLIWGYAGTLLIAEVTGAQQQDIAYTSFETIENGNWGASSFVGITGGITGEKCFSGTGFSFSKAGLSANTKYIVTYWSRNGAYNVPGTQTGYPKLLRSIVRNGITWTLHEHLVTGQTTIQVTGSGSIDELRLHPQGAVMRTFAFKTLLGMSSECTGAHRLKFYDYDELGRLRTVKDDEGKILRQHEYKLQAMF